MPLSACPVHIKSNGQNISSSPQILDPRLLISLCTFQKNFVGSSFITLSVVAFDLLKNGHKLTLWLVIPEKKGKTSADTDVLLKLKFYT